MNIPLINYLCLKYYLFFADYFVKCGKSMNVDHSEYGCMNIVTNGNSNSTAYGNYTIDAENNANISKYFWTLKVAIEDRPTLSVGIDSANRQRINHGTI